VCSDPGGGRRSGPVIPTMVLRILAFVSGYDQGS